MLLVLAVFIINGLSQSPCLDEQYVKLKSKPVDNMSQREYEYFMLKEKNCGESMSQNKQMNIVKDSSEIYVELILANKYRGYMPDCNVYIDDISYGKPPFSGKISTGIHIICLFADSKVKEAGSGDRERMSGAFVKTNVEKGFKTKIIFTYKCNIGVNGKCDENEWYFENDIKKQ
jgi:hypothetical protein